MKRGKLLVGSVVLPVGISGLLFLSSLVALAADGPEERIAPLIVMIDAKLAGEEEMGAGIIVGQRGTNLYIATANHVVRRGGEEATEIQVQFWALPDEPFPAKLQRTVYDLDLAVLKVENADKLGLPPLPFSQLGDAGSLKPGDRVHLIGYPNGHPWDLTRTADAVTGKAGGVISFEGARLLPGHSGGALLDEQYRLVGLLTLSQAPNGKAISMDTVIENLMESRYPVDLKPGEVKAEAPPPAAPVQPQAADPLSTYAARGEVLARDTSLAMAIRERMPEGPMRRGFDIGMGVCEGHTEWGTGKQKIFDSLSNPEQRGFQIARDFSLDRNNNVDRAKRGAAIAEQDPVVKNARGSEPPGLYWLGFDIATAIFGDPALGAQGNTQAGPGSLGIRDKLSADAQRGFNDSMNLHLSRTYRK